MSFLIIGGRWSRGLGFRMPIILLLIILAVRFCVFYFISDVFFPLPSDEILFVPHLSCVSRPFCPQVSRPISVYLGLSLIVVFIVFY